MRDSVMWFLVTLLLITAMSMVYVRHQHRIDYVAYHAEQQRRDELNDEWGRLLIEERLWSSQNRIEKHAAEILSMRAPTSKEVEFVKLPDLQKRRAR